MTIVFNNPHGSPVRVAREDVVVVDKTAEGIVYAANDPTTGDTMMTTVMSEETVDDPMGMEQEMEDMITSSQMSDMEDSMPNPPKALFTWRNLRLQSAISGEAAFRKRTLGRATTALADLAGAPFVRLKDFTFRQIPKNQSIRDTPFLLQMVSADQWFDYLRSLSESPVDVGAELSMTVSPSQRIAVAMFIKEWEQDPGQRTLLRRVVPGANPEEARAIGQMIYDIITGRGPNPLNATGYGNFAYDKMFRLAYDMLLSLPIRFYNTYTLFQLEADEGGKIYSEVVSNYTPLEVGEVGLVIELRQKLAEFGPAYANTVISDTSLAAEAGALMQKAVTAYSSGDTVTVRSILNYLQASPFYYRTPAADAKSIFEASTGEASAIGVAMGQPASKKGVPVFNGMVYLKGLKKRAVNPTTGKLNSKDDEGASEWKNKSFEVVNSPFDNTVAGVIKFENKADSFSFVPGATKSKGQDREQKRSAAAELSEALGNPRGKPQGRGKFLALQIHPKTQLDMKLRATSKSGTGDKRHGGPPKAKDGSQNKWTMGLKNILESRIKEMNFKMRKDKSKKQKYPDIGLMVTGGKHKKTGNWAPYRIKLPKSHFVKQRLPDGTEVIGMKKSLSDKELVAAWQKFTDEYGLFKVQRKDNEMYFIPHKRGAYYDKVRRQIGKAKGSR